MQPYVTPFALSSLGLVLALAYLGCLSAKLAKQIVPPGWRAMRPGFGHWFSALGCSAFSTLLSWVYIFVGSARRDAVFQMKVAFCLSVAFGLCAIYSAWRVRAIKRENIRWRGSRIVRSHRDGHEQAHDGSSAVSWSRTWSGLSALVFADGSTLYIDPFTKGSDEFIGEFGPPEDVEDFDTRS
jgi:hypothetical protein